MQNRYSFRRTMRILAVVAGFALAAGAVAGSAAATKDARHATPRDGSVKPTIVLVHGAWANTASWAGVIGRLQHDGYTVVAPPNPLRSLRFDTAYITDFLKTIPGPVVLVGHSYGGMVISDAATRSPNVRALVYVDAFVPKKGESALGLDSIKPGSALGAGNVFNAVPFPGAAPGDAELYVKPKVFIHAFANGLPATEGAVLAATQEPAVASALTAPSTSPAWSRLPSWYVLGTIDRAIPPAIQLFMARRAHARITRVDAGHLSMVSHPGVVTRVILEAAGAVSN